MAFDLSQYGLYWSINPLTMTSPVPEGYITASAKLNNGAVTFNDNTGKEILTLNLIKILGKGTYGTTYLTDKTIEGYSSVVKVIKRSSQYVTADVITEVIAQILLADNTKDIDYSDIGLKGPFVPRVFLFAKDEFYYYILNETMDYNFDKLITTSTSPKNVKTAIIQIATILDYLFHTFRFNHRDFKADNIMFSEKNGVRLIDFGFCCLNYKGMIISPSYEYPRKSLHTCSSRTRDLNSIFFYMLNYTKYSKISCPVKRVMRALMYDKDGDPRDWANSYGKYNTRPENKNMYPEVVIGAFLKLNFLEDRECSELESSWASEIKEINSGIISILNDEELKSLDSDLVIDYMKKNRPFPFIKKIASLTSEKKVRSACLKLLGLTNNTGYNMPSPKPLLEAENPIVPLERATAVGYKPRPLGNKPQAVNYRLAERPAKRAFNRNNTDYPLRKTLRSNNSLNITDDILIKSATITDENKLNTILEKTYNYKHINYKTVDGETPLMAAAGALNLILVKKLIKFPFIIADSQNVNGDNALHYAMRASINSDENAFERKMDIIETIMTKKPLMSDQKNKRGVSPKELLIKMKREGGRKTRKTRK